MTSVNSTKHEQVEGVILAWTEYVINSEGKLLVERYARSDWWSRGGNGPAKVLHLWGSLLNHWYGWKRIKLILFPMLQLVSPSIISTTCTQTYITVWEKNAYAICCEVEWPNMPLNLSVIWCCMCLMTEMFPLRWRLQITASVCLSLSHTRTLYIIIHLEFLIVISSFWCMS